MMEKEKYGIDNLKVIILAICQFQLLFQQILSNDKKGWLKYGIKLIKVVSTNFRIFRSFNYRKLTKELSDISKPESAELLTYICVNTNIQNREKADEFIKASIIYIGECFNFFNK